jgi:phage gp16-like protein
MNQAHFAVYQDLSNEVYTLSNLADIAKAIWHGQRRQGFNRQGAQKWCDATAVGVSMRKAHFVTTVKEWATVGGYTWTALGNGLEINIETNCRADFPGRFHVRKEVSQ